MDSITEIVKIPKSISNTVLAEKDFTDELYSEIDRLNYDLALTTKQLNKQNKKIKDLEEKINNTVKPKPTPNQERAKKLRDHAFKEYLINTKRAMKILGITTRVQAIRAMKHADQIYDDLYLHQDSNDKKYYLQPNTSILKNING